MSLIAMSWAWNQKGLTPEEKLLLLKLCDGAARDGRVWPDLPDRERREVFFACNMSPRRMDRLIEGLVSRGFLRWQDSRLYLGRAEL